MQRVRDAYAQHHEEPRESRATQTRLRRAGWLLGRRIRGPFEFEIARVNSRIDQQRHDQVMARRILCQNHLLAFAALHSEIVNAAQFAPRDDSRK